MKTSEINSTQKPPSLPEPHFSNENEKSAASMWQVLLACVTWIFQETALWFYTSSLDTVIWTRFDQRDFYTAPVPPSFFSKELRKRCHSKTVEVFCKVMKNYRNAKNSKPYFLCYTSYSPSLETLANEKCEKALAESVQHWLADKKTVHLGMPYQDQKERRNTLSSDFLKVALPLCKERDIQVLHISGPMDEKDHSPIKDTLLKMKNLTELHFELNKKSPTYFLKILPELITKIPELEKISFKNIGKEKDSITVEKETWDALSSALESQKKCTIDFFRIPEPPEPHNKMTFKSNIS